LLPFTATKENANTHRPPSLPSSPSMQVLGTTHWQRPAVLLLLAGWAKRVLRSGDVMPCDVRRVSRRLVQHGLLCEGAALGHRAAGGVQRKRNHNCARGGRARQRGKQSKRPHEERRARAPPRLTCAWTSAQPTRFDQCICLATRARDAQRVTQLTSLQHYFEGLSTFRPASLVPSRVAPTKRTQKTTRGRPLRVHTAPSRRHPSPHEAAVAAAP
jgi:hypothetical protein